MKGNDRFRYFGATHEYCESINGLDMPMLLAGIEFFDYKDGGSKSDKFTRDIKLLTDEINRLNSIDDSLDMDKQQLIEEGILQRKNHLIQRCTFYLAQSWRDLDEYEKALETYEERVKLGGWEEEVYYSLLQIALLKSQLKCSLEDVIQAFLRAYEYRPQRAESLYFLARYLRLKDKIKLAYIYASVAASIPQSNDRLFINYDIYSWKAKDELAVAAYWVENYQLSYELCLELLTNSSITYRY